MKMSKILSLVLVLAMLVSCCAALTSCGKKETITIWVSETEGVVEKTQEQVNRFLAAHPEYDYEIKIEGVTEADAGSKVVADVASAPDIYCFAQDQLARLVQASALLAPGKNAAETIRTSNDAGSVAAASVAGTIYAYPMTSDNGYYLYYDKSVITDPTSLEQIIADCEAANKTFSFSLENAWYTASFFFATGCHSNWTVDEEGNFTSVDDDFNSAAGLDAMKGMSMLTKSSCYIADDKIIDGAAAVVTGVWNANAATELFGDNLGATKLPSFTVGDNTYQLGSYSGNKLMGVKPQSDAERGAFCAALALYLTNEECQLERYNLVQWGPSNLAAQQSDAVQSNPSLAALAEQNEFAIPQPQIHGSWWDLAKLLGAQAKAATSDADLQKALDDYKASVDALFQMSDEEKRAWSVIGNICNTNWDTDFSMTEQEDGTFLSEALQLNAEESLKVRQGRSWDVSYGASEGQYATDDGNLKVETTGTYYVKLTLSDNGGYVELVPAE